MLKKVRLSAQGNTAYLTFDGGRRSCSRGTAPARWTRLRD